MRFVQKTLGVALCFCSLFVFCELIPLLHYKYARQANYTSSPISNDDIVEASAIGANLLFTISSYELADDILSIVVVPRLDCRASDHYLIDAKLRNGACFGESWFRARASNANVKSAAASTPLTSPSDLNGTYSISLRLTDTGTYSVSVTLVHFGDGDRLYLDKFPRGEINESLFFPFVEGEIHDGTFQITQNISFVRDPSSLSQCVLNQSTQGRYVGGTFRPFDCTYPALSSAAVLQNVESRTDSLFVYVMGDSLYRALYSRLVSFLGCRDKLGFEGRLYQERHECYLQIGNTEVLLMYQFWTPKMKLPVRLYTASNLHSADNYPKANFSRELGEKVPDILVSYFGIHMMKMNATLLEARILEYRSFLASFSKTKVLSSFILAMKPSNFKLLFQKKPHLGDLYLFQNNMRISQLNELLLKRLRFDNFIGILDWYAPMYSNYEELIPNRSDVIHPYKHFPDQWVSVIMGYILSF